MPNIVITEQQYRILTEGVTDRLFHFTSIQNGYSIANDNVIYFQSALAKSSDNYDGKRKFYLSCTRQRNANFGYSHKYSVHGGVRIELDGQLLSQNYKGKPIQYWTGEFDNKQNLMKKYLTTSDTYEDRMQWELERFRKKNPDATEQDVRNFIKHHFNDSLQQHTANESEDRIFSYTSTLQDANRYIKSIDVFLPDINNEETQQMDYAKAFLKTPLYKKVHIYTSLKEFNSPEGRDINQEIQYDFKEPIGNNSQGRNFLRATTNLKDVFQFIACANPDFNGNNTHKLISDYLNKYQLGDFTKQIGAIADYINRNKGLEIGSLQNALRDMSDKPNNYNSKIIQLFTDYAHSIGANSIRDAFRIKQRTVDEYYGNGIDFNHYDFTTKKTFITNSNINIVALDPDRELYRDIAYIDSDYANMMADNLAYEIFSQEDTQNTKSKNEQSLYLYLKKAFLKGTVSQVYDILSKLGLSDEQIAQDYRIEKRQLNLQELIFNNYDTTYSKKAKWNDNADWRIINRNKEKQFAQLFPLRQQQ